MKHEVFWKNPGYKPRRELRKNISCDYLIVGGGITGVSIAYFLRKHGAKNIALIEKNSIASGATGRAAGVLTPNVESDLRDLIGKFGKEKALLLWYHILDGLHTMKKISKEENVKCDFEEDPTIYAEFHHKTFNNVLDEYKIEKQMHMDAKLILEKDLEKEIHTKIFKDAILSHQGASVNPLKYSQNLSRKLKGVLIYENTPLISVAENTAQTPRAKISFKKIIIATDSREGEPSIKTTIAVTRRLNKKELSKTGFEKRYMIWDSKKDYDYMKLTKDNRILVGFGDVNVRKKTNNIVPSHVREIKSFLSKMAPGIKINLEYAWSGCFTTSEKLVPEIMFDGNKVYVLATGGQPLSTMAAKYVAGRLFGRKSSLDAFFE